MKEEFLRLFDTITTRHFTYYTKTKYKDYYDFLLVETHFLDDLNPRITDRIHYVLNDTYTPKKCLKCSKNMCRFYGTYCCKKCMDTCEILKSTKIKTSIIKYGVENVSKTEHFKIKYKAKMLENYGVEHYAKTPEYTKKVAATKMLRYGDSKYFNAEKTKNTQFEKYNGKWYLGTSDAREKTKYTCLLKYGVEHNSQIVGRNEKMQRKSLIKYGVLHPMQSEEIKNIMMHRNMYKFKEYISPYGIKRNIQGYEWILLNELFAFGFKDNDIITDRFLMPRFIYVDEDNKTRRYYPDVWVPSINTIYEVKCVYYFNKDVVNNYRKKQIVEDSGYIFEFKIYDKVNTKNSTYLIIKTSNECTKI